MDFGTKLALLGTGLSLLFYGIDKVIDSSETPRRSPSIKMFKVVVGSALTIFGITILSIAILL